MKPSFVQYQVLKVLALECRQVFGEMHPMQVTKDVEVAFWDSDQLKIILLLDENAARKTRYSHTEYSRNALPMTDNTILKL